jgi:hypothetical protein
MKNRGKGPVVPHVEVAPWWKVWEGEESRLAREFRNRENQRLFEAWRADMRRRRVVFWVFNASTVLSALIAGLRGHGWSWMFAFWITLPFVCYVFDRSLPPAPQPMGPSETERARQRRRALMGGGFIGGALTGAKIGAGVGIAAGGLGAIAGTIPGAVLGGLIGLFGGRETANVLVKRSSDR